MPPEFDEERNDAIDRFWDQISQDRPNAAGGLDPADAATIRHLHTFDDRPGPTRAFKTNLREELMRAQTIPVSSNPSPPFLPNHVAGPPRRAMAPLPPLPGWRRGWANAQFATAFLVLLVLALGALALRPGSRLPDRLLTIPALVEAPATPNPSEAASTALAAITLPAGGLPGQVGGALNHFTIPAGTDSSTASTWVSSCCVGVRFDYVLSGSFTLRGDGLVRLLRAGTEDWEDVAAGTEITLNPGDAVLLRMEDAFAAANANAAPVGLLEGVLFDGFVADDPIPAGWTYQDQDIISSPAPLPSGPLTLRLTQSTLAAGGDFLMPDAALQLAVTLDASAVLGTQSDFRVRNAGKKPATVYLLTVEPAPTESTASGTPAATPAMGASMQTVLDTTLSSDLAPTAGNLDFLLWSAARRPSTS